MSAQNTNYAHLTVWNMNGGLVPSDTTKALTEAVESILKDAEKKDGTRLLYDLIVSDPEAK
jgi:hypothetical protein